MLHLNIIKVKTPEEMGKAAADEFEAVIHAKPACVMGLATGSTPLPLYRELIAREQAGIIDFSRVRSANLDEYKGLAPDHPLTKYKEEYVHSDHLLYVQLGENVRKLRKRCHLTQDELAARIGADQKRVSKIERGEARPNLTLCLRLANAFHVSVDTLLEGVVEYEMVQTLLNATSEQLLAQELLQVVKRYIREAEK